MMFWLKKSLTLSFYTAIQIAACLLFLQNAAKFTPAKGSIELSLREDTGQQGEPCLILEVTDSLGRTDNTSYTSTNPSASRGVLSGSRRMNSCTSAS